MAQRIEFENVSHSFGNRTVLTECSLSLTEKRIGIVGSNGSGKSTFVRLINGLLNPTRGTVRVDGKDVAREGAAVRRDVGFIFTDPDSQIIMPTVREDVTFSLKRSGLSREEISHRVAQTLERFGLTALAEQPAHSLSGGEKQLLALAATLVREPRTLIADEPTTLLDARNSSRMEREFAQLPQQLIVVTHQLNLVKTFDRVLVFHEGAIVADAAPDEALGAYAELLERLDPP